MKIGLRRPSPRMPRGSIAARTSWRRTVRHSLGLEAPRGWGWPVPTGVYTPMGALTDPRRAAYNRVYDRTTFSWRQLLRRLLG